MSCNCTCEVVDVMRQATEPPIVLPPLQLAKRGAEVETQALRNETRRLHQAGDWLERVMGAESYGAPRVFDLFTLLAITLAFALLLAALRLFGSLFVGALDAVAITLGAFVTGIAIFQLALWEGKKPRLASLVAGPILWSVAIAIFSFGNSALLLNPAWRVVLACICLLGIPTGYLGGAMVAGVFLIADFFRTRYLRQPRATSPANDDQIFASDQLPASRE